MGPKTKELVEVLGRLVQMLEEDNQSNILSSRKLVGLDYCSQARKWSILESDYSGIEKVLGRRMVVWAPLIALTHIG